MLVDMSFVYGVYVAIAISSFTLIGLAMVINANKEGKSVALWEWALFVVSAIFWPVFFLIFGIIAAGQAKEKHKED